MTLSVDPRVLGSPMMAWPSIAALLALALVIAVLLVRAPSIGVSRTDMYALSIGAVFWGIIVARLVHILDYLGYYTSVPFQVLYIWNGGFSAWGAIIGALAGAAWHAHRMKLPVRRVLDFAVLPGLSGLLLFRFVDFLTGQRPGHETTLPWGVLYAHPASPANLSHTAQHPVALYELVLVGLLLGLVVLLVRARLGRAAWVPGRLRFLRTLPEGFLLVVALAGYAGIRILTGFPASGPTYLGLLQAQWIGIALLSATAYWALRRRGKRRTVRQQEWAPLTEMKVKVSRP